MRAIVLLTVLFALPAHAGFLSEWIPFEIQRGHITIPVTLNGKDTTAIFDTGAFGNGIAKSFLIQNEGEISYGKKMRVSGVFGTETLRLVNDIEVGMFGTSFNMGELLPTSLGTHGLLIGLPFFEKFVVQFDYPNQRMRLASRDVIDLRKFANVKMRRKGGATHPLVEIDFNGEFDTWITLDTGNSGGFVLKRLDAERFDWLERFPVDKTLAKGVTGQVRELNTFRLPEVKIGPFTVENVRVSVPGPNEKTNIGRERRQQTGSRVKEASSSGLLGYDLLKHFVVTIDFKRSLLHLEPGRAESR